MKALLNFQFDQFPEHLTQTLLKLFSSKSHCDVRLIGEDRNPVMGHKVVLAAFSKVLNDVIKENSVQTLDIKIHGINHDEIKTIVQFMYLGEASVAHSGVDKFLRIAKFLGVSQLSDQCKADVFELNKEFSVNSHVEMNEETMAEEAPEAQGISRDDDDSDEATDYEESNVEDLDECGINELKTEIDGEMDEETTLEEVPEGKGISRDEDEAIYCKESNVENLDEYGINIGEDQEEVNLKEEINAERKDDETYPDFLETYQAQKKYFQQLNNKGWETEIKAISEDCSDITIGEPALDFDINSSVYYSHNFYRKVNREDGSYIAFCLMCWKKDKTRKLVKTTDHSTKGIKDHMASRHAEFVDEYVKQRQKVEAMRNEHKQYKVELKNQQKRYINERSRIRLERKERKEQKIESVKLEKIDKQHKEKELVLIQRAKKGELRAAKQKQFQEAQAKMRQFAKKQPIALNPTGPRNEDDIDMAEKVLQEEFIIGEPSDLNFSVFSSVFWSHNFYRKCENRERVLCLMCLRSENKKMVFLMASGGNFKGMVAHIKSKHPKHAQKFLLQNEIIQGLRNAKRDGKL